VSVLNKLKNPFVLVGEGFLVGALLFWTSRADAAASLLSFFS
jgi:hypothetical protein